MKITLLVAFLMASPLAAAAQEGGIDGTVTDDTGRVLPGVTVEASSAALSAGPQVAVTDGDGRYAFMALPPEATSSRSACPASSGRSGKWRWPPALQPR